MDTRSAPLLPPALAFVSGTALSFHLTHLSIPLLVSLLVVSFLRGNRAGVRTTLPLPSPASPGSRSVASRALARFLPCVTAFSLGLLWSAVCEDLPRTANPGWSADRPVVATVRVTGFWRPTEHGGWSARAEIERLRQRTAWGLRVERTRLPAFLSLPDASDGEPPPALGTRVRVRGFLRRSEGYFNGDPGRPGPWRLGTPSRRFVEIEEPPRWIARRSHRLRAGLERALEDAEGRGSPSPGTALVRALVLGDSSRLAPEVVRGLRRSGLGHLLALSGLHLGLVAGLVWMGGAALRWRGRGRLLLMLAAVTFYLLIAGPRPSLIRAAVLVTVAVTALALERPPSPSNALALALLLLVVHRPGSVGDLGFQLTMAATGGILLLAPWWMGSGARMPDESPPRRRHRRGRRAASHLKRSLAVTLAAQVATLPWALPAFHGLSPSAPWLNLVAVPWTALVVAASFAWLAAAWTVPPLASFLQPGLDLLAVPLGWPARAPAGPWWFLPLDLSGPAAGALALGLGVLLGIPARWRRRRSRTLLLSASLLAFGAAAWWGGGGGDPAGPDPRLVLLDVGQGDAVLVQDGPRAVLVDGGGFPGGLDHGGGIGSRVLLPALLRLGVRRLDAVVLTHPDRDHCGGLVELASWLPVAETWVAPGWEGQPCAEALLATPGVLPRQIAAGGRGRWGRWRWWALHPALSSEPQRGPQPEFGRGGGGGENSRSLVLALEVVHGRRNGERSRVLLTGDVDAAGEAELLRRFRGSGRQKLRAHVLKVPHHGSGSSSTLPFLAAVFGPRGSDRAPPLALISAGRRNPYGHPAPEVLARLGRWRARIWRTDLHGRVQVTFPPPPAGRAVSPRPVTLAKWSPSRIPHP